MSGKGAPVAARVSVAPITAAVRVDLPPPDAFAAFVDLARWWPREYTWSGGALEGIGVEPRLGGFCWERGPQGIRLDWGRVTAWDPPRRLAIAWQIGPNRVPEPNPARASQVEIRFSSKGLGTGVEVEHSGFDRHGPEGEAYRDAMAGPSGWPLMIERYAETVRRRVEAPWEGLTT